MHSAFEDYAHSFLQIMQELRTPFIYRVMYYIAGTQTLKIIQLTVSNLYFSR